MVAGLVAGVWVDNAAINERFEDQSGAEQIALERSKSNWQGLYFGGVAFKYSRKIEDLERSVQIAARFMDVVTTSGTGTGKAADLEKIRRMKHALTGIPLAIANGITPENVLSYLEIADCFLVATGISQTRSELDAGLVQQLVEKVRSYPA